MEVSLLQSKRAKGGEKKEISGDTAQNSSHIDQSHSTNRTQAAIVQGSGGVCIGSGACSYSDPSSCENSIFGCKWIDSCSGYCTGGGACNYGSQGECERSIFGCSWKCNAPTRRRRSSTGYLQASLQQNEGNQVGSYMDTSNSDCASNCDANPTCKSFSWTPDYGGKCYLKDKCVHSSDATTSFGNYKTYYKPCHSQGSWNSPTRRRRSWNSPTRRRRSWSSTGYLEASLQQNEGNQVASWTEMSNSDCAVNCDRYPTCKSFSWTPDYGGKCYLKDKCVHSSDATKSFGNYKTYYKPCQSQGSSSSDQCPGTANCWDEDCANRMFDRRRRYANMGSCRRRNGPSSTGKYVCCGNQMRYYTR